jgi:hypothetical protein
VVAEEINQILQFLLKETNSNELQDNEWHFSNLNPIAWRLDKVQTT